MDDEKHKYQMHGIKWLFEMELVSDPQLVNTVKLNIFSVSNLIREVEIVMSQEDKKMLIWIEVSWFTKTFRIKKIRDIEQDIISILGKMLPNFKFRVITDISILNMAVDQVTRNGGSTYAYLNRDNRLRTGSASQMSSHAKATRDDQANTEERPVDESIEGSDSSEAHQPIESEAQSAESSFGGDYNAGIDLSLRGGEQPVSGLRDQPDKSKDRESL